MDELKEFAISELKNTEAGKMLSQVMESITKIQKSIFALVNSEDDAQLNLLKIGTVFQVFLIDMLAARKDPQKLTKEDWKKIADQVVDNAILEDGQRYSEFVFNMYADYIDTSAKVLKKLYKVEEDKVKSVKAISGDIRQNSSLLRKGKISEVDYVEKNLWLSLEAMVKCLSLSLTLLVGKDYAKLAEAVSMLGFEYGRYVLYAKEQAILQEYIDKQYALDEQLHQEFEAYLAEVKEKAKRFQTLVDDAFSPDLRESLLQSVALAKASGVKDEEILRTVEEIDDFFM